MNGKARLGLLLGLAGCGLLGWSLFTTFTAACIEPAAVVAATQTCSSDPAGWVAFGIPGGIILAVLGLFLGGGFLVFAALFMAIGLSALIPTWLGLMPAMASFGWLFGGIFFLCGLLPFFLGAWGGRVVANKRKLAQELMATGTKGIGTIVEVTDTGVTLNDNPRVTIRMRIEPLDGSPLVERSKTAIVSRVAIPRAGERYPAWFDRNDPDKWMFGTAMDETASAEVKELFARARAAGPGPAATGEGEEASPVEELETLTRLWKDGALSDREFSDAKDRLLARIGR